MTIANILTIIRIFISPIFMLIYLEHDALGLTATLLPAILLLLLGISELSDAFDGYLARKYNQVTDFGKILDPMADSIYHISVYLTFTLPPINLPILLVFLLIYRDTVISALRTICALHGLALAARLSGKIKAICQAVGAFTILILLGFYQSGAITEGTLQQSSFLLTTLIAVYTIFSGMDYILANKILISKVLVSRATHESD